MRTLVMTIRPGRCNSILIRRMASRIGYLPAVCIFVLFVFVITAYTQDIAAPLIQDEVYQRLVEARDSLRELVANAEENPNSATSLKDELHRHLSALSDIDSYVSSDGREIELLANQGWMIKMVRRTHRNPEEIPELANKTISNLDRMIGFYQQPAPDSPPDRELIEEILSRPEIISSPEKNGFLEAIGLWIVRLLSKLNININPGSTAIVVAAQLFMIGFLVFLGIVVLVMLLRYLPRWKRQQKLSPVAVESAPVPASPKELLNQAGKCMEEGRFREALHYHYTAFVVSLSDLELVPYAPKRTNWEILRSLRRLKKGSIALDSLEQINRFYDITWYGEQPCSGEKVKQTCLDIDTALAELLT
jgi:hypothetical protein